MNWLDFMCRVGTTITTVCSFAAIFATSGAISGSIGGSLESVSVPIAGTGIGIVGSLVKSGEFCDKAAHDMYMRQKCEALLKRGMYVRINGK